MERDFEAGVKMESFDLLSLAQYSEFARRADHLAKGIDMEDIAS